MILPGRRLSSIVVLICALAIFLFPASTGPYSAVHGPVTALRALHAALAVFWSLTLAILSGVFPQSLCRLEILHTTFEPKASIIGPPLWIPILRC